jgi:hypothetical protein
MTTVPPGVAALASSKSGRWRHASKSDSTFSIAAYLTAGAAPFVSRPTTLTN